VPDFRIEKRINIAVHKYTNSHNYENNRINKAFENNAIVFFMVVVKKKQNVSWLKILHNGLIKRGGCPPPFIIRI